MVILESMKITGVAVVSMGVGGMMMTTSVMLIRTREMLSQKESILFWVWVFTLLTIGAGFLQLCAGVCLLLRKIVVRRWITVNVTSFLTIILAVCILSTTIFPEHRKDTSGSDSDKRVQDHEFDKDHSSNETEVMSMENFIVDEDVPTTTNLSSETEDLKEFGRQVVDVKILNFYCGSLIADLLVTPMFLGLMAMRVKQDFKARQLVERTYVYPLVS